MGRRKRGRRAAKPFTLALALFVVAAIAVGLWVALSRGNGVDAVPEAGRVRTVQSEPIDKPPAVAEDREYLDRPLAVVIDNSPAARPQSGPERADILYEVPAEGGVTRYLAIFMETPPAGSDIGPVRSVRPYIVDLAKEYGAVLVHCGGSPEALAMLKGETGIRDVDDLRGSRGFHRVSGRKAPHNLYVKPAGITGMSSSRRPMVPDADGAIPPEAGSEPCDGVVLGFSRDHTVEFRYGGGSWVRSVNGRPDASPSGNALSFGGLIIRDASIGVTDEKGRLEMGLTGGGKALLFKGGRRWVGTWEKPGTAGVTRYEFGGRDFVPGKGTYVALLPLARVSY